MNKYSKPIIECIRDWLLFVGAEYSITEAHYNQRPDNQIKSKRDFFAFRFQTSSTNQTSANEDSTSSDNDATILHWKTFERQLTIECHSEDGMDILESLIVSMHNPGVDEIINNGRLVIIDIGEITNLTEIDESPYPIEYVFSVDFRIRKEARFSKSRTNHILNDVTATGTLESDSGAEHTITATASRGE